MAATETVSTNERVGRGKALSLALTRPSEAEVFVLLEELRARPRQAREISATLIGTSTQNIPPSLREPWLKELARYQRACGCGMGAAGAIAGFVLTAAWQALHLAEAAWIGVALPVKALGAAVFCVIMGKLLGLFLARERFRRATKHLIARLSRPVRE
jgi:hypothetical protein